jgi:hypothetical protein
VQLAKGVFSVTSKDVKENTIHYTWTCQSSRGNVDAGKDTLGIKNGKVIYHYCNYDIT